MSIKIIGVGSFIPTQAVTNLEFAQHQFYTEKGDVFPQSNEVIAKKFKDITGIAERRYADDVHQTSDLALFAAQKAIENAEIDPETIDYIILAHNFGDVKYGSIQSDIVPSLASRVKHQLKIKNNNCVAYDILFGCPGWLEGMIQAYAFIKAGIAKTCLVIGSEMLSRVVDHHDRDSMIFADGAGATILSISDQPGGMLAHQTTSHTFEEAYYLHYGASNKKSLNPDIRYIKMLGRKIYEFSLIHVPKAMKSCWDKTGLPVEKISKILIHQANEKMDEAIVERFYQLYGQTAPKNIMPMNIQMLGNSSVATIPTLFDMIVQNKLPDHHINKGDYIFFASVGAGMNINAIAYQM